MGRYYQLNQNVLANCGTRDNPEWIPGKIIELTGSQYRPYRVYLERESDGKLEWNFPVNLVKADTLRNRKKSGLTPRAADESHAAPGAGGSK